MRGREELGHPKPRSEIIQKVLLCAAEESTRKTIEFQKSKPLFLESEWLTVSKNGHNLFQMEMSF